jgi:acetamidase/formamidase
LDGRRERSGLAAGTARGQVVHLNRSEGRHVNDVAAKAHTLHHHQGHFGWARAQPPALTIAPGESVEFHPMEASGGQITPSSTAADIARLDFDKVNPVVGPVFIDGAEPGDAIKVTLIDFEPSGWGWTAIIPGFGLLADQFAEAALNIWTYATDPLGAAMSAAAARIPLKPFCGTMGLAPAEPGRHSVVPPRRVGGNMDVRDLSAGSELYLPVEVTGGLFSLGDTHAAQGDGEVCGTAIESPMSVRVRLELVKDAQLRFPRFVTAGPVTRHLDAKGYDVTTGIGPDLMEGARAAVSGMIELLCRRHRMSAADAYMLCSVCADLRVSEIVDAPNWIVSLYFPRVVFE